MAEYLISLLTQVQLYEHPHHHRQKSQVVLPVIKKFRYSCELYIRINRMFSSPKHNQDIVLSIYKDKRSVFRLKDIALLVGETNFQSLNKKLNYYVTTGKLLNPRKGVSGKLKTGNGSESLQVYFEKVVIDVLIFSGGFSSTLFYYHPAL